MDRESYLPTYVSRDSIMYGDDLPGMVTSDTTTRFSGGSVLVGISFEHLKKHVKMPHPLALKRWGERGEKEREQPRCRRAASWMVRGPCSCPLCMHIVHRQEHGEMQRAHYGRHERVVLSDEAVAGRSSPSACEGSSSESPRPPEERANKQPKWDRKTVLRRRRGTGGYLCHRRSSLLPWSLEPING